MAQEKSTAQIEGPSKSNAWHYLDASGNSLGPTNAYQLAGATTSAVFLLIIDTIAIHRQFLFSCKGMHLQIIHIAHLQACWIQLSSP